MLVSIPRYQTKIFQEALENSADEPKRACQRYDIAPRWRATPVLFDNRFRPISFLEDYP